jgi:uncharacterized membrane protein YdbT with pleckstrin-like domain
VKTALKNNETLILETRPHWFTLITPAVVALAISAIGLTIGGYGIMALPVMAGYFIYKFIERNNTLWAVTNLRVVVEYGVFALHAKESPLDKINNVSYTQPFLGRIFGYGDVEIQTAAEIGSTTYYQVAHPRKLKDTITLMQETYKQNQMKMQAAELANALLQGQPFGRSMADELEKLHQLKQQGILTEAEYLTLKAKLLNP